MRIGLTFTAKGSSDSPAAGKPDDHEEEFDSPATIAALAEAVGSFGHEVVLLGDGPPLLRSLLSGPRPDLVFNIAEGAGAGRSREARVPAVLEMFGVPYTGSDPLTCAATLDKDVAKRLVGLAGVAVPKGVLVAPDSTRKLRLEDELTFPVLVKPAFEGSSKGIRTASLLQDAAEAEAWIARIQRDYDQPVLVEEFVDGRELTVGLLGAADRPEVLGVLEVVPRDRTSPFVYSLEVKRDWERRVSYECPAPLSGEDDAAVREAAKRAWKALGCRDVSRIDFRLRAGVPVFIECNPLPGLSPGVSDLVILASKVGVSHTQLVGRILDAAIARLGLK